MEGTTCDILLLDGILAGGLQGKVITDLLTTRVGKVAQIIQRKLKTVNKQTGDCTA